MRNGGVGMRLGDGVRFTFVQTGVKKWCLELVPLLLVGYVYISCQILHIAVYIHKENRKLLFIVLVKRHHVHIVK